MSTDTFARTAVAMGGHDSALNRYDEWRVSGRVPKRRLGRMAERTVHRKGNILVVETDDLIRGLLTRWLGEAGYAVHACAAGDPPPDGGVGLVVGDVANPRRAGSLVA